MARAEAEEKRRGRSAAANTNGEVAETAGGKHFHGFIRIKFARCRRAGRVAGDTARLFWKSARLLGPADNKRVIKPRGVAEFSGHFCHANRAGHRAGDEF